MSCVSDEMLYYGGIAVVVCVLIAAIVFFFISKLKAMRLEYLLKEEYGEENISHNKVKSK